MDDCTELQNAVLATATIEDFLREVPMIAVRQVAGAASCGMIIRSDGRPTATAASDQAAAGVDEVQYRLHDGPGPQAMREGEVVTIDDTAWSTLWPEFEAQAAAAAGIRSCLAVPVQAPPADTIGVLSLYARETAAFGDEQAQRAEQFAENTAVALAIAERLASCSGLNEQLRASLASRPVIDQALGIIMAREKCSQAEAFAILRTTSQNSNTKLRDLAARIVTDITGEPVQPPPFVIPGRPAAARRPGYPAVSGDPGEAGEPGEPSAAPTLG